jgi:glutathionyl-hydroquinone reductase
MGKRSSLPPGLLVQVGRFTWTTMWRVMIAQLAPSSQKGEYQRPNSQFRHTVGADSTYPPAAHRYKLMVGQGCPWAHRAVVVWTLKGLEHAIPRPLSITKAPRLFE